MAVTKVLWLSFCFVLLKDAASVTVNTTKGPVTGFRADYGSDMSQAQPYFGSADVFLGIPYAEPPVGSLRFQPPQAKAAWNSALDTTSFDSYSQCPQPPTALGGPTVGGPAYRLADSMSEDCLYLNVFSPNVSSTLKYPVIVFIHGGSLVTGSTRYYEIKGTVRNLVNRGVVVVTIQYRLGLLGSRFFTTKTPEFPANLGMLDQVLALQWVQLEIAAFGGDASQVTLFGASAGGASVSAHTYSPLSKGLIQKAIMESGTVLLQFDGTFGYERVSEMRAKALCNTTDAQWTSANFAPLKECLQNMTVQRFLDLDVSNPLDWSIVVDGNFMPALPRDIAANRTNIPILIGTNRDEWALWELLDLLANATTLSSYTQQYWQQQLNQFTQFYGENQTIVMQLAEKVYVDPILPTPDPINGNTAWFKAVSQFVTDALFVSLTAGEVDLWLRINNNTQVYLYEFVYPTTSFSFYRNVTWPVWHAEELFYVWMQETLWENNSFVSANDYAVANFFGQTWTDFAKNGKVNWSPVTLDNPYQYLEIDVNVTQKSSYRETARVFWNQIIPAIVGVYPQAPSNGPTSAPTTMPSGSLSVMMNSSVAVVAAMIMLLAKTRLSH